MRVLITGASSGIGYSFASLYAKLGYDLVLASRSKEKLVNISKELGSMVKVEVFALDLSKVENCYFLYDKVRDIDILINNAGFGLFGEFNDTSLDRELEMIDVNIRAVHVLMKLYLQDMLKKDYGKILNVASIAGFLPGPLMSTYYATKNYVVRMSRGVYEELRRNNSKVVISVLCPGPVKTNFDEVASVKFSLKGLPSDVVARCGIRGLNRNKFYIIPGFQIRLLRIFAKLVPDRILARIVYCSQRRKG